MINLNDLIYFNYNNLFKLILYDFFMGLRNIPKNSLIKGICIIRHESAKEKRFLRLIKTAERYASYDLPSTAAHLSFCLRRAETSVDQGEFDIAANLYSAAGSRLLALRGEESDGIGEESDKLKTAASYFSKAGRYYQEAGLNLRIDGNILAHCRESIRDHYRKLAELNRTNAACIRHELNLRAQRHQSHSLEMVEVESESLSL